MGADMEHLHCQDCGAHFTNRAELDDHNRRCHEAAAQSGQRGELAADAAGGIQERPAAGDSVAERPVPQRPNRDFTRSHKE